MDKAVSLAAVASLLIGCTAILGDFQVSGTAVASGATDAGVEAASSSADAAADAGSSCPVAQQCNGACCDPGAICIDNHVTKQCAKTCTSNNKCPSAQCCTLLADGRGACLQPGTVPGGQACRCTTGVECGSGACAPAVDATGNPVGPYICKANEGASYTGCHGLTTCNWGHCCVADAQGNEFCAVQCLNSSTCGAARCNAYNFSFSSCSGPKACGP